MEQIYDVLAWLIIAVPLLAGFSITLHAGIEEQVKPILKKIETATGLPSGARKWLTAVGAFVFAFITVWQMNINLFADVPIDVFQDTPEWAFWILNAAVIAAGSYISHPRWEVYIKAMEQAKNLLDILRPQDTNALARQLRSQ